MDILEALRKHGIVGVYELPADHPARVSFEAAVTAEAQRLRDAIDAEVFERVTGVPYSALGGEK
jgi:hypothetical protein